MHHCPKPVSLAAALVLPNSGPASARQAPTAKTPQPAASARLATHMSATRASQLPTPPVSMSRASTRTRAGINPLPEGKADPRYLHRKTPHPQNGWGQGSLRRMVLYTFSNWFMVLCSPLAFRARSPATISLKVSPRSEPTSCWCFTAETLLRISWRWIDFT